MADRTENSVITETIIYKLIPLFFAIPLTLRVLEITPAIISDAINFITVESIIYAGMLYAFSVVSFIEMNFARHEKGTFVQSMNAGASIMAGLSLIGLILGTYVLMTQYAFNGDLDTIGRIISYYMLLEVGVLIVGMRIELGMKVRFSRVLKNI